MKRNIYLNPLNFEDALARLQKEFAPTGDSGLRGHSERVSAEDSLGRVSSAAVTAQLSNPNHNASAMDGICVKAESTMGADPRSPLTLRSPQDFIWIDTGDVIPASMNAVIMIEDLSESDETRVVITAPAHPWQHIRPVGEDIVAGEMIIPSHHRIRPVDMGALIAGGITEVEVIKRPVVGIIPTGTEIIETPDQMKPGAILDSNSRMFSAMVTEYGGLPKRYSPVIDDYEVLRAAVSRALDECDMVVIGAGSSAGSEDYSKAVICELGELLFHGVAIKPGKPAVFGRSGGGPDGKQGGKPLICIPGYPVSAWVVFDRLVQPLVRQLSGIRKERGILRKGILTRPLVSSLKHLEFVRVKCGLVGDRTVVTPLSRGAGISMSLVQADAIVEVPREYEGYQAGEEVELDMLKPWSDIEGRLVSIGSHDLLMDILAELMKSSGTAGLTSTHSGSMGGVMAVKRGECHIAPVHVLDPATGIYNSHLTDQYMKDGSVVLVKGVKRIQGLIVRPGNPRNIMEVRDLTGEGIVYVNRQRGAGTRILFDYLCDRDGVRREQIEGYTREMGTHMAVAQAVLSGTADAGMGVASAAGMMGLDFIPVGEEDYDFLVREDILESDQGRLFLQILQSEAFARDLERLGGYRLDTPGKVAGS